MRLRAGGGRCSAQFISRSGHILTAGHCLLGAPTTQDGVSLQDRLNIEIVRTTSPALAVVTDFAPVDPPTVPVELWHDDGDGFPAKPAQALAQVLLMGRSFNLAHQEDWNERFADLVHDHGEDFAILRLVSPAANPCVRVSERAPRDSDRLWIVGNPTKVSRPFGLGSDGNHVYVSTGIVRDPFSAQWLFGLFDIRIPYERSLDPERVLVSDADAAIWSSGAMAIDRKGEVVGVTVLLAADEEKEVTLTSLVRGTYIRDFARQHLPRSMAREAFDCD